MSHRNIIMPSFRALLIGLLALCASPRGGWAITSEKGRTYDFQQFIRNRDCSAWGLGSSPVPEAFKYDMDDPLSSCSGVINTFYYFKTITFASNLETSVLIRALKGISEVMWNTWAHYDSKAVDTLGKLKKHPVRRQPASARTIKNKNIAIAFALARVSAYLIPPAAQEAEVVLDLLVKDAGLSHTTTTTDPTSPAGIGNLVAQELIATLKNDGWNSEGKLSSKNSFPFADYTDYKPANSEYTVDFPTRYQPLVETDKFGYFFKQFHTTPQLRSNRVRPWSVPRSWINNRKVPGPWSSALTKLVQGKDWAHYKGNVTAVLKASASLTETQKLLTEFFDNKVVSFGGFERWYAHKRNWCIDDWIKYDQLSACLYDSTILAWKEKIRIDAIRPASAIRFLREKGVLGATVRSWGGKDAGYKTTNVDPYKWQSYMRTMPHSEFPSGTSCICSVWAEWTRLFQKGSDKLDLTLEWKPGCSSVEQGVTPKAPLKYTFKTISQAMSVCKQSRLWAGVHFQASLDGGQKLCSSLATKCFAKVQRLTAGNPN